MEKNDEYTGIILAGGQGNRIGMDKGLIAVLGNKLIEHATRILSPFCREIIISSNNPKYKIFPFRIVNDVQAGFGPMMGIYPALKGSKTKRNLVLAVDNVFVTRTFYQYLLTKKLFDCLVAVPYVKNKYFEPLIGYYSKDCTPHMELMMQKSNYKLPDLFSKLSVNKLMVELDFPDFHHNYFKSLNYPEDLLLLNGQTPDPER